MIDFSIFLIFHKRAQGQQEVYGCRIIEYLAREDLFGHLFVILLLLDILRTPVGGGDVLDGRYGKPYHGRVMQPKSMGDGFRL